MDRRNFLKLSGIAAVALVVPIALSFKELYAGQCKSLCEHCIGKDSRPLSGKYGPFGPVLCEYHGALVYKLKQLTLQQLEYLSQNPRCKRLIKDMMSNLVVYQ